MYSTELFSPMSARLTIYFTCFLLIVQELHAVPRDVLRTSCKLTDTDILGPFYKPNSPIQATGASVSPLPFICPNSPKNDRLILNGTVRVTTDDAPCGKPVRALLDIWHADPEGEYSNSATTSNDFTCRSRLLTGADGFFTFSSLLPGRYDDGGLRPAHVHFTITPLDESNTPAGKSLTTQLYFAHDHFLKPVDSCGICGSGNPSQITHVTNEDDFKTFIGSWDVLLDHKAKV
ncbi:hypothetical protein RvY_18454 [Ramazzottius varieornatus]|uniref:Intradiol ring-cleavage dioxygenases domain-containing protein n=1 Tax=Ramazzottius varieornatus TaxID=947166 RepID=A0A1D1W5T4_RAMVA|nr:hypothetical protein RvY_18454 [Ramazzottius varieornatus]